MEETIIQFSVLKSHQSTSRYGVGYSYPVLYRRQLRHVHALRMVIIHSFSTVIPLPVFYLVPAHGMMQKLKNQSSS